VIVFFGIPSFFGSTTLFNCPLAFRSIDPVSGLTPESFCYGKSEDIPSPEAASVQLALSLKDLPDL
jgi:hypothetical protein